MNGDRVTVEGTAESDAGTAYSKVRTTFGGHEGYMKTEYLCLMPTFTECVFLPGACEACGEVQEDGSQCMCSC
jgi:hypothetical protein